jgi:hypothetical protein
MCAADPKEAEDERHEKDLARPKARTWGHMTMREPKRARIESGAFLGHDKPDSCTALARFLVSLLVLGSVVIVLASMCKFIFETSSLAYFTVILFSLLAVAVLYFLSLRRKR